MKYLGTIYGSNISLAIRCVRYYQSRGKPFTSAEIKIKHQTLKNLSNKGILQIVSGEKVRDPNRYVPTSNTIELLKRRFPDEL